MAFWEHLWASWGDLGAILGVSWNVLGGLGGGLEASWEHLRSIFGCVGEARARNMVFRTFFQVVFKFSALFNIVNH